MKKLKLKKIFKNKKLLIIIGILLALLVAGVSAALIFAKDDKKPILKNKNNKNDSNVDVNVVEPKKVQIVDVESTSRPYAVMINNINVARPLQSGLQDAYIIYEIIVEGGITRYMALFLDQDTERIGSVRSARHYYLDYALENDAIYVHHGQSEYAQSDFGKLGIDRIVVDNSKTGWRDKSLKVSSEHTLFTSIEKLNNGIGKKRTTRNNDLLLEYSADSLNLKDIKDSKVANNIDIRYSNATKTSYEYDAENKVYKRSVNGKAHTDYVTKEQYTFKNIITYQVENTKISGDNYKRQNLNNIGSGTGYYISEGYAVPITWEKTSRKAQTIYKMMDGTELKVNDGNTFIQIQPKGETLNIS